MDTLPVEIRVKITLLLDSVFDVKNMTLVYPELLDLSYVSNHLLECKVRSKVRRKREKKEAQIRKRLNRELYNGLHSFIRSLFVVRNNVNFS